MRRGQPRNISSGRPRRGQAAAPPSYFGVKRRAAGADTREDSKARGLTAITSCGFGDCGAAGEDTAALLPSGPFDAPVLASRARGCRGRVWVAAPRAQGHGRETCRHIAGCSDRRDRTPSAARATYCARLPGTVARREPVDARFVAAVPRGGSRTGGRERRVRGRAKRAVRASAAARNRVRRQRAARGERLGHVQDLPASGGD